MRLKSIELQGYKTFAGRTPFKIAEQITCIVGPNGSGKSNIADAIRWVLGEQSYSLLRGKKTVDMIFDGSTQRSRAGMASVEIIFDNTNGWLPVDFSEVSIGRRAYRDGSNEYRLNGQKVRLKDIAELLGNSGLSERTYTVIGQGLVDSALSLRAEERRRLFEEAAGIGLYRSRRDESHRRLDTTLRNLERVQDILVELKPRLRSLERQSRRAKQYEQVRTDLQMLLREWHGYHWHRSQQELNEARTVAKSHQAIWDQAHQDQLSLDQKLSKFREHIQGVRARLGSWHRELSQFHAQRETMTRELAVADERRNSLLTQHQNALDEQARIDEQISAYSGRIAETESEVTRLGVELDESHQQAHTAQEVLSQRQKESHQMQLEMEQDGEAIASLTLQQNRLQARSTERAANASRQDEDLAKINQAVIDAEENLVLTAERLASAEVAALEAADVREHTEKNLAAHRQRLAAAESERKEVNEKRSLLQADLARLEAQLEVLEQAEKVFAGYASGTQLLLNSSQKGKLKGAKGAFSTQLQVPEALEAAVAAALGEYLDAVLLDDRASSLSALEILNQKSTRGALLPLNALVPLQPLDIRPTDGVEGVASALVKAPSDLRPAVDLLLGQTIIVSDRTVARHILTGLPNTARAVTLRGEVFYASGQITSGLEAGASTLSRPRKRLEMTRQLSKMQQGVSDTQARIEKLDQTLEHLTVDAEKFTRDLESKFRSDQSAAEKHRENILIHQQAESQAKWQKTQQDKLRDEIALGDRNAREIITELSELDGKIAHHQASLEERKLTLLTLSFESYQAQVSHWNTQVAVAERALADAKIRHIEGQNTNEYAERDRNTLTSRLTTLSTEAAELEQKIINLRQTETEVAQSVKDLMVLIDPAEQELSNAEDQQVNLQRDEAVARQALSTADRHNTQMQLKLTRRQEALARLQERVEADFGLVSFSYADDISGPTPLPMGDFVEQLPTVLELPEGMGDLIKQQRAQLRRMGAINPEAQQEYEEVSQRYTLMVTQIDDLKKAEADIREVISELDILMEREFRKTFDAVAIEFRDIFTRLFGGGSARLVLTNPDNMTDTGIDIDARLPGRRSQSLSLLSGGERSLTATALVFALLKISPTPFCVLDEVDAMLDEANVGRFRELLRELSHKTQFIVITHNRNTVQVADIIYGVTMGRDTTSQVISLKLDEIADAMV
ncbi:MAG: chromosome segregation protein SMC [Anaerolineae bacterium]|nr:chromosome segregation protein SMC [Anaerolineae bacterium]